MSLATTGPHFLRAGFFDIYSFPQLFAYRAVIAVICKPAPYSKAGAEYKNLSY